MTTFEAKKQIKKAGGKWKVFIEWMFGQTYGMKDGEPDWYECDVERFIHGGCDKDKGHYNY